MKINKDFILQYGLLYGVTMSGYSLISYIIGIDFMLNWFNVGFAFLLPFGLTYYIGTISRSKNGGFISWKEAFTELFLVLAAGFFVIVAFDFVLNTLIDPELPMELYDKVVEKTMKMLQGIGSDEATLNETYKKFEEGRVAVSEKYTAFGVIRTYISGLFFQGLVAALIALFIKKENPNPFSESEEN